MARVHSDGLSCTGAEAIDVREASVKIEIGMMKETLEAGGRKQGMR